MAPSTSLGNSTNKFRPGTTSREGTAASSAARSPPRSALRSASRLRHGSSAASSQGFTKSLSLVANDISRQVSRTARLAVAPRQPFLFPVVEDDQDDFLEERRSFLASSSGFGSRSSSPSKTKRLSSSRKANAELGTVPPLDGTMFLRKEDVMHVLRWKSAHHILSSHAPGFTPKALAPAPTVTSSNAFSSNAFGLDPAKSDLLHPLRRSMSSSLGQGFGITPTSRKRSAASVSSSHARSERRSTSQSAKPVQAHGVVDSKGDAAVFLTGIGDETDAEDINVGTASVRNGSKANADVNASKVSNTLAWEAELNDPASGVVDDGTEDYNENRFGNCVGTARKLRGSSTNFTDVRRRAVIEACAKGIEREGCLPTLDGISSRMAGSGWDADEMDACLRICMSDPAAFRIVLQADADEFRLGRNALETHTCCPHESLVEIAKLRATVHGFKKWRLTSHCLGA